MLDKFRVSRDPHRLPDYRRFGSEINARWQELGRKIKSDVVENRTSLILMENPFIVPGGRFREMYYWDTYWTILGLIQSEMTQTVKGARDGIACLSYIMGPNSIEIKSHPKSYPKWNPNAFLKRTPV